MGGSHLRIFGILEPTLPSPVADIDLGQASTTPPSPGSLTWTRHRAVLSKMNAFNGTPTFWDLSSVVSGPRAYVMDGDRLDILELECAPWPARFTARAD